MLSRLAYSSAMKMEATCSSETSVDFRRTTRRYIPEDRTVHTNSFFISISLVFESRPDDRVSCIFRCPPQALQAISEALPVSRQWPFISRSFLLQCSHLNYH
jgi:hypothetical protein